MFEINPEKKKKYQKKNNKRNKKREQPSSPSSSFSDRVNIETKPHAGGSKKQKNKNLLWKKKKNIKSSLGSNFSYAFSGAEFLDHFETPRIAYKDIATFLSEIAYRQGTTSEKLRIYDPYFCRGSVITHLAEYGFHNVHNSLKLLFLCFFYNSVFFLRRFFLL